MIGTLINFKGHIKYICRKADQKLSALLRISSHISTDKKALLYKSMIKSQFGYCLLVWMFCFRQSNNLINKGHERALKLICQANSNFEVLLEKQHNFSICQRNLQVLMTEIYKGWHFSYLIFQGLFFSAIITLGK